MSPGPKKDRCPKRVCRVAGRDRFDTAALGALEHFGAEGADTVYLAVGTDFPDALAGGALAGSRNAPILLTAASSLPAVTADALETLAPTSVVALGGPRAISDQVLRQAARAAGGAAVTRIAGTDRFATAAAIADRMPPSDTIFLAVGTDFPDALAGSAAKRGAPVLLTSGSSLPDATSAALTRHAPGRVIVLGGRGVISDAVLRSAAAASGAATTRLAGSNRFATATAIAATLGPVETIYLATGLDFPDALAAGPLAAADGAPILLTPPNTLSADVAAWLEAMPTLRRVIVLGGSAAVGDVPEAAVERMLR